MFGDPDGSVTGGRRDVIHTQDVWSFVDKQQSPSEKSMPTSGEAGGGLGMSVGGDGEQAWTKNTK